MFPNGVISILVNVLLNATQKAHIKIEGALQQFEISQFYECGHPVYFQVFSCGCDCYKDNQRKSMEKSLEHPSNYAELCAGNHLCFNVTGKHLIINRNNQCAAYGVCSLRFSPIHIYQNVLLKNPKTFNILKLNRHESIFLPTKYTSLVEKNNEFKIHCMNKTDYPRANQPGWYFWLKGERERIFRSKYPQTFNTDKAVNGEKYCWYQLGNEEAVRNKIVGLDPLTNEVCNGNKYALNFRSLIGLHQKGSILDESDALPGIQVQAGSVKFSHRVAEFYYFCKVMSFEYESNFLPWFEGVYRKDEEIYLKTNLNVTSGRYEVPIAVWDQSGHEIMREKSVLLGKFVALSLHNAFSSSAGTKTLVCISVNQSANWCEHLDVKNASEAEMHEYYDYFLSISSSSISRVSQSQSTSPSTTSSSSTSTTSTSIPTTLNESKDENTSESDLSNSTLNGDLNGNSNAYIWILVFFVVCLVLAIGIVAYCWRKKWKERKNGNLQKDDKDSSEQVPLRDSNPESIPEHILGSIVEPSPRPNREAKIEIKNAKVDSINYYYYNNNLTAGGVIHQNT